MDPLALRDYLYYNIGVLVTQQYHMAKDDKYSLIKPKPTFTILQKYKRSLFPTENKLFKYIVVTKRHSGTIF